MNRREKLTVAGVCLAIVLSALALFRAPTGAGVIGAGVNDGTIPPPNHATRHATGGLDAISAVTTSTNGLALATDKTAIDQRFADGLLSVSEWLEEFECTSTTATPATATVVNCDRPWRTTFSGTGAAVTLNNTVSDATHPGTIDLYAGTGTAGQSGITRFTSGLATYQVGSGQANKFDFIFRLDVLSDGTNTFTARVGGTDAITALPNNGAFIEYSSASPSSGNFICRACAAASCNDGTGGSVVAAVADTWYHGQVVTDGTTTSCTIDGTNIGSTTSTQPTAPINASAFILNSAGTGANRRLYLDAASRRTVWSPKKAL